MTQFNIEAQDKDTTLDEILLKYGSEQFDAQYEASDDRAEDSFMRAKQALLQWRDRAVVEALQNVLNEYANQYQKHASDMGRTTTPFTIFHKIINEQLKETPNED